MALEHRFAVALRKKAKQGFKGYPSASVAYYGPDDTRASKVAVGVVLKEGSEPDVLERWHSEDSDVRTDPDINQNILSFIRAHAVRSVVIADRIIGCPHEEGIDYPMESTCPQCPFWSNKDRWTGEVIE